MSGIAYSYADNAVTELDGVRFCRGKDKYGRNAHEATYEGRTLGLIVRMPKSFIRNHEGQVYLTNDWTLSREYPAEVRRHYHRTLREARQRFVEIAARIDQ